jgi:hypothetical protein
VAIAAIAGQYNRRSRVRCSVMSVTCSPSGTLSEREFCVHATPFGVTFPEPDAFGDDHLLRPRHTVHVLGVTPRTACAPALDVPIEACKARGRGGMSVVESVVREHEAGEESEEDAGDDADSGCLGEPRLPVGLLVVDCERDQSDEDPDCEWHRQGDGLDDGRLRCSFGGWLLVGAIGIERSSRTKLRFRGHRGLRFTGGLGNLRSPRTFVMRSGRRLRDAELVAFWVLEHDAHAAVAFAPGGLIVDGGVDEVCAEADEAVDFGSWVAGCEVNANAACAGRRVRDPDEQEVTHAAIAWRLELHEVVAFVHDGVARDG